MALARETSPLPRRTDSLSSSIIKSNNPNSPLVQSREDAQCARVLLGTPITTDDGEAVHDDRDRQMSDMLERMTAWVEELGTLLQQAYKNQTDLETALTLTRSNLALALANNEMLEEALKRGGGGGKDVGWRRWSEREGVRRSGSVREYPHPERLNNISDVPPQASATSRFFNFKSSLQRISSINTSPTATGAYPPYPSASASASTSSFSLLPSITIPSTSRSASPAPPPTTTTDAFVPSSSCTSSPSPTHVPRDTQQMPSYPLSPPVATPRERELTALLEKERAALKTLATAKAQVEDELESLSQALFEEANKMVAKANRKLAETEEELRITTEQKEALHGALKIVEGENGALRGLGGIVEQPNTRGMARRDAAPNINLISSPRDIPRILEHSKSHPTPPTIGTVPEVSAADPDGAMRSSGSPVTSVTAADVEPPTMTTPPMPASPSLPTPTTSHLTQSNDTEDTDTNAQARMHRWSKLPAAPRARNVVRGELEDAVRRMQELVGEDVDRDADDVEDDADASGVHDNVAKADGRAVAVSHSQPDGKSGVDVARSEASINPWRT